MGKFGGFLDRMAGVISPTWGARRLVARVKYEAAQKMLAAHSAAARDRTTADWPTDRLSADQANLPELADINARSRLAVSNDGVAASIKGAYRRNVVGNGIKPRAAAFDLAGGDPLTTFNEDLDWLFKRWARNPRAVDVEQIKTLHATIRLAMDEWATVGSSFIVMGYKPRRDLVGLTLQMFEVEQLDTSKDTTSPLTGGTAAGAEGNQIRNGIEIDAYGAPVAYHVFITRHPLEGVPVRRGGEDSVRIPAERVIHLTRKGRVRETLAITRLGPVLRQMFDRQGYDLNELFAKKLESFLGFAIKKDVKFEDTGSIGFAPGSGATAAPGGGDSADAGGNRQIDFQPGSMPVLYGNEEIQAFHFDRPGANYDAYMQKQIDMISAGADLSGGLVARKAQGSYSAARQEMLEDWKSFDIDQQDMIDLVLRPIWERFVFLAIIEGRLKAPGFFDSPDAMAAYMEAEWQPPARPWVDPAKEAAALKIMIDYGLANHADALNKLGSDWRDNARTIAEVMALYKKLGIPMPWLEPGGPKGTPSDPKVHGAGDEPGDSGDAGESPRTQSQPKGHGQRAMGHGDDGLAEAIIQWAATHDD